MLLGIMKQSPSLRYNESIVKNTKKLYFRAILSYDGFQTFKSMAAWKLNIDLFDLQYRLRISGGYPITSIYTQEHLYEKHKLVRVFPGVQCKECFETYFTCFRAVLTSFTMLKNVIVKLATSFLNGA